MAWMYSDILKSYYTDTNEEGKPNEAGAHHARLRKRVPDARNTLGTRKGIRIVDTSRRSIFKLRQRRLEPFLLCGVYTFIMR